MLSSNTSTTASSSSPTINNNNSSISSSSTRCLSVHNLRLSAHFVEKFFIGILLPPVILFGLIGNCLTLSLLLSRHRRTRSDLLLSLLAFLDIFFLLLMLPNSLAHFDVFALNYAFRRFYFATKVHLLALINQCSAAAIWTMLGICLERFVGISRPLSVRKRTSGTLMFVVSVLLLTFFLTFYVHFSYGCIQKIFCNGTQLYNFCSSIDSEQWLNLSRANAQLLPSPALLAYVRYSPMVHALFVVFLPSLLIAIFNLALLWTLHRRDNYLGLGRTDSCDTTNQSPSVKTTCSLGSVQKARIEHRVTITVAAIVSSFTLTQMPSAVLQLLGGPIGPKYQHVFWVRILYGWNQLIRDTVFEYGTMPPKNPIQNVLSVFLVTFGKSINFVLFCLSSANFRTRLALLLNSKFRHKRLSLQSNY